MNAKATGEFILQKRKEKNLTQVELADLLGVTNKAVSRWETGEGYPDVAMLPKIAIVLGTTVDEILQGKSNSRSKSIIYNFYPLTAILSLIIILSGILATCLVNITFYESIGFIVLLVCNLVCVSIYILNKEKYKYINPYYDKRKIYFSTLLIFCFSIITIALFLPYVIFDPNLYGENTIKVIISFDEFKRQIPKFLIIGIGVCAVTVLIYSQIVFDYLKYLKNKKNLINTLIGLFIVALYCVFGGIFYSFCSLRASFQVACICIVLIIIHFLANAIIKKEERKSKVENILLILSFLLQSIILIFIGVGIITKLDVFIVVFIINVIFGTIFTVRLLKKKNFVENVYSLTSIILSLIICFAVCFI